MGFVTTANKDALRDSDLGLVKALAKERARKLTYFGLSGTGMLDVIQWKEYLGKIVTVEKTGLYRHFIRGTAFYAGILDITDVLAGDIDDVILRGEDDQENLVKFGFDLVNLDYQGGIIFKQLLGGSKRISAMKRLIEQQSTTKRSFVLFLTAGARNRDQDEFNQILVGLGRTLKKYGIEAEKAMAWYASKTAGYDFKLKVYVPYVLSEIASPNHYKLIPSPPVTYVGTGDVRMVHFAFKLEFVSGLAAPAEKPTLVELINLPMLESKEGKVVDCPTKAPKI